MKQMSITSLSIQDTIGEYKDLDSLCDWITKSNCDKCQRHVYRNSNSNLKIIPGSGNMKSDIWIVGKSPGVNDSVTGVAFAHKSGELLDKLLLEHCSLNRKDCFITNSVFCPEADDAEPKTREIQICSSYFDEMVKLGKPKIFLAVGATAHKALISPHDTEENFYGKDYAFQSRFFDDNGHTIPLFTIYHTAYWLRTGGSQVVKDATITTLQAFGKALKFLNTMMTNREISSDLGITKQATSQLREETLRALRLYNVANYFTEDEGERDGSTEKD